MHLSAPHWCQLLFIISSCSKWEHPNSPPYTYTVPKHDTSRPSCMHNTHNITPNRSQLLLTLFSWPWPALVTLRHMDHQQVVRCTLRGRLCIRPQAPCTSSLPSFPTLECCLRHEDQLYPCWCQDGYCQQWGQQSKAGNWATVPGEQWVIVQWVQRSCLLHSTMTLAPDWFFLSPSQVFDYSIKRTTSRRSSSTPGMSSQTASNLGVWGRARIIGQNCLDTKHSLCILEVKCYMV